MHPALPRVLVFAFTVAAFGAGPILGQGNIAQEAPVVTVDGVEFATWSEYTQSEVFREGGVRCGTPRATQSSAESCQSDCGCRLEALPRLRPRVRNDTGEQRPGEGP